MYLKKGLSNGRVYLSAVHGYWDSKTKKVRAKTVCSFGYVDELEKDYPDPLSHFRAVVKEMDTARKADERVFELRLNSHTKLTEGPNRKNFGFSALSFLYHELELNYFFDNRRDNLPGTYNLSSVVKLLVYGRLLNPGSKAYTHARREEYFEKFDFSLDSVYRALTTLAKLSEDIQLFLHKRISKLFGRSNEIVYYDVTNYYFESEQTTSLREKGYSKENRPDPIVQMGLLIDDVGLPITFDLFKGSTVDCQTLLPVLAKIKKKFGFEKIVVVADKGLNTSSNVAYNLIKKDGYLFSKSIRKADAELRGWVLDKTGYQQAKNGSLTKSRLAQRVVYVLNPHNKKVAVPIEEKQVAVFSEKYAKRQAKNRQADIDKAYELISDASRYSKATHSGAKRFVKGLIVDKKTGEVLAGQHVRTLDRQRIKDEEALDGYYLLTTSEKQKSAQELMELYSGLWKIEDSFRITKSELEARPVYLSRDDHIQAHFLTCYIALVLMRLLEIKTKHRYSTKALMDALQKASASHLEGNRWIFNYTSETLSAIGQACGIDFSRKYLTKQEIGKIIGDTKKVSSIPQ